MAAPRGKRVTLLAGSVAVLALAAGIVASWGRLREEWYLWRLSSPNESTRQQAAVILGELR